MTLNDIEVAKCKKVLSPYIERIRPPLDKRDKFDISFRIENQSVIVFELRLKSYDDDKLYNMDNAKATYVRSKNHWKIFWMRADLKWHSYPPVPTVKSIEEFVKIIEEDENRCFWG